MIKIDQDTHFLGVLGYPVYHSKSPAFFNQLFKEYNINAVYRYIETKDIRTIIEGMREFNYKGFSVTIPHKEEAMKYVDEVSDLAKKLGCINTIWNDGGVLKGYNFDGIGAGEALRDYLGDWVDKKILILGTGGAARGISMSFVYHYGVKNLYFLNRNKKSDSLYEDIKKKIDGVEIYEYTEVADLFDKHQIDIIINTTPVGMKKEDTLLFDPCFLKNKVIFDIIYTPKETLLLREAKSHGCEVIYGYEMFIGQALKQFELWYDISLKKEDVEFIFQTL